MPMKWLTTFVTLMAGLVATTSFAEDKSDVSELLKPQRVVFLGDSITYAGQYIAYVESYLTARFPAQQFEFIDIGLPSETCSGLSEPGHAGGKFPRPDVHERLGRVIEKLKPKVVVACYGMNCGMYHPLSDERLAKYQEGQRRLRSVCETAGAKVIHLTPPVFDPLPLAERTLPAGRDSYSQPYEGYNEVLDRFSEWLVGQRQQGWTVIDIHGPMNRHLAERRKTDPKFVLAGDGVHAGPTGHWLMAEQILAALNVTAEKVRLTLDATTSKITANEPASATRDGNAWTIEWKVSVPMAIGGNWDAASLELAGSMPRFLSQNLTVIGLTDGPYDLFENDVRLKTVTAAELKSGINLATTGGLSSISRAVELQSLITRRQRLLTDAWLNEVGHLRPGMSKGIPVADAMAQAKPLSDKITELAQPVSLKLRIVPQNKK